MHDDEPAVFIWKPPEKSQDTINPGRYFQSFARLSQDGLKYIYGRSRTWNLHCKRIFKIIYDCSIESDLILAVMDEKNDWKKKNKVKDWSELTSLQSLILEMRKAEHWAASWWNVALTSIKWGRISRSSRFLRPTKDIGRSQISQIYAICWSFGPPPAHCIDSSRLCHAVTNIVQATLLS